MLFGTVAGRLTMQEDEVGPFDRPPSFLHLCLPVLRGRRESHRGDWRLVILQLAMWVSQ